MVDRKHQFLKASFGIEVCESSVHDSFCAHALKLDVLELSDIQDDELFCSHPSVLGPPFLRFYMGVVLRGPSGKPIGTLCIMDTLPRFMSRLERSWLITFGQQFSELINHENALAEAQLLQVSAPIETPSADSLAELIRLSEKGGGYVAVLHMRLKRIDEIYRRNGPVVRNHVLECLAERLKSPDSKVLAVHHPSMARFGAVIPVHSIQDLFNVITAIVAKLSRPIILQGVTIQPDIDVSISLSDLEGVTLEKLLEKAEAALNGHISHEGIRVFNY
ncbi:hypothetical protein GCM10007418_02320 [Halopseudomonas salina]|uniref:GAF domain-containing protein n=2 Tax=Halopseudomonas salina TaxID=1323744 RepID=A0ABQ1NW92_9GAMM|nr:hypothetical protein GCM10007418_02320 [Halopseudomonas salina]